MCIKTREFKGRLEKLRHRYNLAGAPLPVELEELETTIRDYAEANTKAHQYAKEKSLARDRLRRLPRGKGGEHAREVGRAQTHYMEVSHKAHTYGLEAATIGLMLDAIMSRHWSHVHGLLDAKQDEV